MYATLSVDLISRVPRMNESDIGVYATVDTVLSGVARNETTVKTHSLI